jgi:hypothetical protein
MGARMNLIRKLGYFYFAMFVAVAAMSYVPQFKDENGMMFGLFSLQLHDDLLHLFSGIWAGVAAWISARASIAYFKLFGALYFLDGVLGFITGSGYLDLGIFLNGPVALDLATRFFANAPHLAIGGFAAFAGFVLSKKHAQAA